MNALRTADYLFPKDLRVTPTRLRRVLITGSSLSGWYHHALSFQFPDVTFDYVLFNSAGDLPPEPPAPVADYDFQYVQFPLRTVLTDRAVYGHHFHEPGFAESILTDGFNLIDMLVSSAMLYNEAHGLLTMVCNFFVPQMSAAPSLRARYGPSDLTHIVHKLNEYLAEAVNRYQNAYVVDVNAITDSLGKQYALDDMIYFYSNGSLAHERDADLAKGARIEPIPPICEIYESRAESFVAAVYEQMIWTYRTVRQTDQVDAVIFDLDNTLWRGQLAEQYRAEEDATWPAPDGWPMGIWEAIHYLRARGILVAVCSKNDQETVESLWSHAVRPEFISLNDFSSVKINWNPKVENILAICAELNLRPESVVVVDDNPVERAAVKAALPAIRVIGSNPYLTRRILLWSSETQVADESIRREDTIRKQIVPEETQAAMTRDEFLATLGCSVTFTEIGSVEQAEFGRALELINRTNQFNTTGKRWSHREIEEFFAAGGRLLAFHVSDRFAAYGLVGALLVQGAEIVQFVMNRRVLGMEVERSAVAHVVSYLGRSDSGEITAPLKYTADNTPCRQVYAKCGFELTEESGDDHLFVLGWDVPLEVPAHIIISGARVEALPMISYCIVIYRPIYARLLLADLVAKTSVPYEILIWLNVADETLEADIESLIASGIALRVIGRTPENVGMVAYQELFRASRYPLIVQIDDDVVCISRGIAQRAARLFRAFPNVRQLVSDVWQDDYTTGARPPMDQYTVFDPNESLYDGPIDGWFAIYHRSILPMLLELQMAPYLPLGAIIQRELGHRDEYGVLDLGMKVFHVVGPQYAAAFGMLQFEIEKYRRLNEFRLVQWYEDYVTDEAVIADGLQRIAAIRTALDA